MSSLTIPKVRPRSIETIEHEAEIFLRRFCRQAIDHGRPIDILRIFDGPALEELGFQAHVEHLPTGIEGYTDFGERICAISEQTYETATSKRRSRFTIAHEMGHVWLHADEMCGKMNEESTIKKFHRSEVRAYVNPEWQANVFAGCILMPRLNVIKLLNEGRPIKDIADTFEVSMEAARIRAEKVKKTRPSEDLFMYKS